MNQKGFTIIESVLAVVIIATAFVGLSFMFSESAVDNVEVDISRAGLLLAQDTMNVTMAKDFDAVVSEGPTAYGGNFSPYSYQVDVAYADESNPDVEVVEVTGLKRVTVTVTRSGWPGSIVIRTIKADI